MLSAINFQFDLIGIFVFLIPWIVAIGWLTSRVLGIRVGRRRSAIGATLGWFVGAIVTALIFGDVDEPATWLVVVVAMFFGVLATMPIVIALDLLSRRSGTGERRWRRFLLHPVAEARARLAPYGRLRQVLAIARRENILHLRYTSRAALGTPEFGRRLSRVLETAGGMFVKFGQIASTRTDLLPEELTDELAKLRSDVATVPPAGVRGVVEAELGEAPESAFASFDYEPVAAASIGQIHRATLAGGERVVVKVQRPGIGDVVRRDASVLRLATAMLERRVAAASRLGVGVLSEELISGIEEELDFQHEAHVGARLRDNRLADDGIAVPQVHQQLSTQRVLVMEEVVGAPLDDERAVDACGVAREELAGRLLGSFLGQVLEDGLYHADPHPGNVYVDPAGTLWLLDFGAVGRLDPVGLEGLQGIALGFGLRDPAVVARALRHLAGDEGETDLRALEADVGAVMGDLDAAGGFDPEAIRRVLAVMERHGLRPPASVTLLGRAMLTLEGTLKLLSPGFDLARRGGELVARDSSAAFGTPEDMIQRELLRALPALRTLPEHAETLANQLRAGRLTLRSERFAGPDGVVAGEWVDRVVLAGIGSVGALTSALLLLVGTNTDNGGVRAAVWTLGFAGLAFAWTLLMRTTAQALRRLPSRQE